MEKLHFKIDIKASKEKAWNTMLEDKTYRIWTEAFAPGSYYKGDWNKGSKILFLAPGEKGEMGMVSRIKDNRKYEFISIEHLGDVKDGKEYIETSWAGALENYTFKENKGKTEVLIEVDSTEEFKEMFQGMWPKALQKLKELAEK